MRKRKPSRATRSPTHRKYLEPAKDPEDSARPPLKKRKSTKRVDRVQQDHNMDLYDFQTPHPTLESQSQTFKLPSSSPQPSPRALSPVPGALLKATSSKYFKENAPKQEKFAIEPEASSTPWNRHSSNPFASMRRISGHIPPVPFSRKARLRSGRHRPSRSHSRSSSNSNSNVSSRANSKEPHIRNPKSRNPEQKSHHLLHESKLKHTQSLSSLDPTKSEQLNHPKGKPSSRKLALPRQGPLSLASPFVSRASSPVEQASGAHISTQIQPEHGYEYENLSNRRIIHQYGRKSSTRGVLADILPDPNLPEPAAVHQSTRDFQPRLLNRGGWLQNVQSSLEIANAPHTFFANPKKLDLTEKTARKTRPSARTQTKTKTPAKFLYAQARNNSLQPQGRERRPSAPSSLRLPKELRPTGRLSVLGPGRAGGSKRDIQGGSREKEDAGIGETDEEGLLIAAGAPGDAKVAAPSGIHIFLEKLRHSSATTKDGVGDDQEIAQAIPPTPVRLMEAPALQALANSKPSHLRPLPSGNRQLLHPSASMDDLHGTARGGELDRSSQLKHTFAGVGNNGDDEDRTAWMHVRSGVDFNRPPSQMEVAAAGLGFGYADAEYEDTFFTSSESEGDGAEGGEDMDADERDASSSGYEYEHEENAEAKSPYALSRPDGMSRGLGAPFGSGLHANLDLSLDLRVEGSLGFGFGFENSVDGRGLGGAFGDRDYEVDEEWARFGEDACGVSTPAKDLRLILPSKEGDEGRRRKARRASSFPGLRQGGAKEEESKMEVGVALARSVSYDDLKRFREEAYGDGDGEEDMDLTGSAATGQFYREDDQEDGECTDDSWITDSLISAPTAYLERKRDQILIQEQEKDEDNHEKERKSSSTLDGPSFGSSFRLPAAPGLQDADAQPEDGGHELEEEESSESHTHSSSSGASAKTATRTRSGTIVPDNPRSVTTAAVATVTAIPLGSRRTRSGTIVGPLPSAPPPAFTLPARPDGSVAPAVPLVIGHARVGAAPIRTRSGTIVASASVPRTADGNNGRENGHGQGQDGRGRMRSGSVVQARFGQSLMPLHGQLLEGGLPDGTDAADADEEKERDDVVECYADSLYVPAPADASSPDPIDFLRFASIAEAEDEDDEDVEWRVIREPPSPQLRKGKQQRGKGGALRGLATRAASAGRWLTKGKSEASKIGGGARKVKARKRSGVCDGGDEEEGLGDAEDSSEDELLLIPGATISFWS